MEELDKEFCFQYSTSKQKSSLDASFVVTGFSYKESQFHIRLGLYGHLSGGPPALRAFSRQFIMNIFCICSWAPSFVL